MDVLVTWPEIGTAPVLSVLVGVFHTGLYAVIRGRLGARLALVLVAAVLGAFAGQAIGSRLGDPVRLGDYPLLWASLVAWAGILIVAITSTLGPTRPGT